jgi:GNAT superfamily N-acetyltransferase
LEIRRAVAADWAGIWPIWRETAAAGDSYVWPPDTPEDQARAEWMLPPPAEVWVAVEDGRIVATALLQPNKPGLGDHVANAGFMVDPAVAGRGIGRGLAEHVLRAAKMQGYEAMQFNAVVETNVAAVDLWRSLGFEILATVPAAFRHPVHGRVGLHVMYRAL